MIADRDMSAPVGKKERPTQTVRKKKKKKKSGKEGRNARPKREKKRSSLFPQRGTRVPSSRKGGGRWKGTKGGGLPFPQGKRGEKKKKDFIARGAFPRTIQKKGRSLERRKETQGKAFSEKKKEEERTIMGRKKRMYRKKRGGGKGVFLVRQKKKSEIIAIEKNGGGTGLPSSC